MLIKTTGERVIADRDCYFWGVLYRRCWRIFTRDERSNGNGPLWIRADLLEAQ